MALTEINTNKTEKKSQEVVKKSQESEKKTHDIHRQGDKKEKPLTKVVIRRLPPNIDQNTFLSQISPVPDYDYIYTVKGDASLGENSFSRVYINFTKSEEIYDFKEKFDNYVFIDSRGHEYPAVVEFAAFQKIPKKRNKNRVDPKCGTIETDPLYLEFVDLLNKPQETEIKAEYSYQIASESKPNLKQDDTTPLLEYIKNKRAEKMRIREERREERKRKELERRKIRDDERRKRYEEKSPIKTVVIKAQSAKSNLKESKTEGDIAKAEKDLSQDTSQKYYEKASYYKSKEKKYEDRRRDTKPKYMTKKEYPERREYKSRRDDYKDRDYKDRDYKDKDYRSKYDERRESETKSLPKKVKKYSEKREERKVEAQKSEQKKLGETTTTEAAKAVDPLPVKEDVASKEPKETKEEDAPRNSSPTANEHLDNENKSKEKDSDTGSQKRIRNKDRPTLAIYRPGMLSKRRQTEGESETKDVKKE